MRTPLRLALLVVAGVAVAFQLMVPALPPQVGYVFSDLFIALAAGYASVSYLRRSHSEHRRGRAAMLAGFAAAGMWSLANVLYLLTACCLPQQSARQAGDVLSVAAATIVPVGLILLAPAVHGMARFRRFIDIAAVSGATFALTWQFVLAPSLHRLGSTTLLTAALTLPEVVAAAVALVTLSGNARRQGDQALHLLAIAAIVLAVTALASLRNSIEAVAWYTSGVGGGFVFAAGVMAIASRQGMPQAQPAGVKRLVASAWTLVAYLPIVLAVAATATMQLRDGTLGSVVVWVLLATFSLVLLRQFLTLATVAGLAVKLAEQKEVLAHQAHHDALTGLPNRAAFYSEGEAVLSSKRYPVIVMLLDLDGFKPVNDRLGHAAGDDVLVTVAARLTATLRPNDLVARLGGDEFAILLSEAPVETGLQIAERVLQRLIAPMTVQSTDVAIGCSIGVTTALRGDCDTLSALVRKADLAMYVAKSEGKGLIRSYGVSSDQPQSVSAMQSLQHSHLRRL